MTIEVRTAALNAHPALQERSQIDVHDLKRLLSFSLGNNYVCFEKPMLSASPRHTTNLTMQWLEYNSIASFSPKPIIFVCYEYYLFFVCD